MKKIKSIIMNEFYTYNLLEVYAMSSEKYVNLSDEELKEYFCSKQIPFRHKYPKVSTTLHFKGNLRISWSFDIKHNKNIDLIFFPQNNPFINYALLYAKDFPKQAKDDTIERGITKFKVDYNINYDFVKEILSKAGFSETQQKRFFDVRFGSVLVPIEVEFEWYAINLSTFNKAPLDFSVITFPKYDKYIRDNEAYPDDGFTMILGIIKSYKILPQNTSLDFSQADIIVDNKPKPFAALFAPLPTSALAITKTNINDFIVNVRDKPDSKEGKIIAQLLSQETNMPDIYITDSNGIGDGSIKPIYKPMLDKGKQWYERDTQGSSDEGGYILYYNHKMKQSYYESNKSNLTNPLWKDDYLILIWDILPNDWAKVWILKMPDKNTISSEDNETKFSKVKEFDKVQFILNLRESLLPFIDGSYAKTFNQTPSKLKLYEGYIHSSGLEYLAPFGENYIKR